VDDDRIDADELEESVSSAKLCLSSSFFIAAPPYLTTNVLPRNRRMYGSASRRT
jgi:hypothetical protein